MLKLNRFVAPILALLLCVTCWASGELVKKVIVEGNQRLPDSSVTAYCPIKKGDVASDKDISMQSKLYMIVNSSKLYA